MRGRNYRWKTRQYFESFSQKLINLYLETCLFNYGRCSTDRKEDEVQVHCTRIFWRCRVRPAEKASGWEWDTGTATRAGCLSRPGTACAPFSRMCFPSRCYEIRYGTTAWGAWFLSLGSACEIACSFSFSWELVGGPLGSLVVPSILCPSVVKHDEADWTCTRKSQGRSLVWAKALFVVLYYSCIA